MCNLLKILFIGAAMVSSSLAFADLDPELAAAGNKNDSGIFIGGGITMGQAYGTGGSNPGVAYMAFVEPGYNASRDAWGRIEASFELGAGQLNFRRKGSGSAKVEVPIKAQGLAKIGYGWSIGSSMFSVIRIGAGPVIASFKSESDGVVTKSDGDLTGLASMIGYDLVVPMGSAFDIVGGLRWTHVSFDLDDVTVDGQSASADEPININVPALNFGIRVTF